jgi:hypothetical protein
MRAGVETPDVEFTIPAFADTGFQDFLTGITRRHVRALV